VALAGATTAGRGREETGELKADSVWPAWEPEQIDRLTEMAEFIRTVLGEAEGIVALGFGINPFFDADGKYGYNRKDFFPRYYRPEDLDQLIADAVGYSDDGADVFYTPMCRSVRSRNKIDPHVPGWCLFADVDGLWTPERDRTLRSLGARAELVGSGSGGRHVYVHLARALEAEAIEVLNRRLGVLLADPSGRVERWERNSLLRLVGTFNHKANTRDPAVPPTPVVWSEHITGRRMSAEELGRLLPADPGGGSRPGLRKRAKRTEPGEQDRTRSGWLWRYVGQLVRQGLPDDEIHARIRRYRPAVAKWGEGEDLRADIQRCIEKRRATRRSKVRRFR
jgi:hypothetical protein